MTAAPGLPRRDLCAVLGLPWAVSGPVVVAVAQSGPVDALWRLLRLLEMEEATFPSEDDEPGQDTALARTDAMLADAARIRPNTAKAFAVKALIVQRWGNSCAAGQMAARWLLYDLIDAGSLGAEPGARSARWPENLFPPGQHPASST